MTTNSPNARTRPDRHREALELLNGLERPFLLGGGYALTHYTGGVRGTKDLDVFVRRQDALALLDGLARAGLETDLTFPHWLGKVHMTSDDHIDVIFGSGNGLAEVDDEWFAHSVPATRAGCSRESVPARRDDLVQGLRDWSASGTTALISRTSSAPARGGSTGAGCSPASDRTGVCS